MVYRGHPERAGEYGYDMFGLTRAGLACVCRLGLMTHIFGACKPQGGGRYGRHRGVIGAGDRWAALCGTGSGARPVSASFFC